MKSIVFATPPDARYGFDLAGVRQLITSADALPDVVAAVGRDSSVGVLAIDERLIRGRAHDAVRAAEREWDGVVVVVPAPGTAASAEDDYIRRLIGSAIGYQVRVTL